MCMGLFCKSICIIIIFLDSTYKRYHVCLCFSVIISRSIHVAADGIISFSCMPGQCSIALIYRHHPFSTHSPVDGHLGCFHVLAVVSSAVVNKGMHVSLWIRVSSFVDMPRTGTSGSCGNSTFSFFKEPPCCFPQWQHQRTFPPTVQEGSFSPTPSPAFGICRLFNDVHSDWGEGNGNPLQHSCLESPMGRGAW